MCVCGTVMASTVYEKKKKKKSAMTCGHSSLSASVQKHCAKLPSAAAVEAAVSITRARWAPCRREWQAPHKASCL